MKSGDVSTEDFGGPRNCSSPLWSTCAQDFATYRVIADRPSTAFRWDHRRSTQHSAILLLFDCFGHSDCPKNSSSFRLFRLASAAPIARYQPVRVRRSDLS